MTISDEKRLTVEDLLCSIHGTKKARERETVKKTEPVSRKLPLGMIVLVLLIVTLGTMVTTLKTEITTLKADISDLKKAHVQLATNDPGLKIASLENKFEEAYSAKEAMKGDIVQIKNNLEELKITKAGKRRLAH